MASTHLVETLSSRLKRQRPQVEIIQHKTKKAMPKKMKECHSDTSDMSLKINEQTNIKKLQNEVIKFTNRFDTHNSKLKEELAIKLGAKPRKNNFLNYKQLKEKLKQEVEKKKNQEKLFKIPKTMIRTSKNKKTHTMKKNKSLNIIQNYGTVKNKM